MWIVHHSACIAFKFSIDNVHFRSSCRYYILVPSNNVHSRQTCRYCNFRFTLKKNFKKILPNKKENMKKKHLISI